MYRVVKTTKDSITVWDGETMTSPRYSPRDPHAVDQRATMEFKMRDHRFTVDDTVMIVVRKVEREETS